MAFRLKKFEKIYKYSIFTIDIHDLKKKYGIHDVLLLQKKRKEFFSNPVPLPPRIEPTPQFRLSVATIKVLTCTGAIGAIPGRSTSPWITADRGKFDCLSLVSVFCSPRAEERRGEDMERIDRASWIGGERLEQHLSRLAVGVATIRRIGGEWRLDAVGFSKISKSLPSMGSAAR